MADQLEIQKLGDPYDFDLSRIAIEDVGILYRDDRNSFDIQRGGSGNLEIIARGVLIYHPTSQYLPAVKDFLQNPNDLTCIHEGADKLSDIYLTRAEYEEGGGGGGGGDWYVIYPSKIVFLKPIQTNSDYGEIYIGADSADRAYFNTDRDKFVFNKPIYYNDYYTYHQNNANQPTIDWAVKDLNAENLVRAKTGMRVGDSYQYEVWHAHNSNISTVDWTVKDLNSANNVNAENLVRAKAGMRVGDSYQYEVWHAHNSNISTVDWTVKNLTAYEDVGSETFASGFAGSGWKLDDTGTDFDLTVDNLVVRKGMMIYELTINQIRATNGSEWVSDSAKISYTTYSSGHYYIYIDTDDGNNPIPFVEGDILRCQRWTGRTVKYYALQVISIETGDEDYINAVVINGSGTPGSGDIIVRIGHVSDTNRQGAIYLTSSDSNAPYIDVVDEVTGYSLTNKTKVRVGKLTGITDSDFGGQLSGYGLYSKNVYLKGKMRISEGAAAGFTLTGTYLEHLLQSGSYYYRMYLKSTEATSGQTYGRGLTINTDNDLLSSGDIKLIGMGQIRNKNTITNWSAGDYGFEVLRWDGGSTYKHIIRFSKAEAIIGNWTIKDTYLMNIIDGNKYIRLQNSESSDNEYFNRGLCIYNTADASPIGAVKVVTIGRIRDKDTLTSWTTGDYGFEIIKRTGEYVYKHIIRIAGEEALFAGWIIDSEEGIYYGSGTTRMQLKPGTGIWCGATAFGSAPFRVSSAGELTATSGSIAGWIIDNEAIYKGTKKTSGGFSEQGITLCGDGSIHAENFFINADGGDMGIRAKKIIYAYTNEGETVILRDDEVRAESGDTYVKKKSITLGENVKTGRTIKIKFDLAAALGTETAYGRIYRNGSPVGDEVQVTSTEWYTKTQNITGWSAGDNIELWMKVLPMGGGRQALTQNLRVCGAHTISVNEVTEAIS